MKIAYVITRADAVGGASIHVRDLAQGMVDRGHQAVVLVGGEGPVTDELARAGVPFHSLQCLGRAIRPLRDLRAVFELMGVLRKIQPDLVSTHTAKAGLVGRVACARLRIPALYTPHGWTIGHRISPVLGPLFGAVERIAARFSSAIICVCEAEKRLALSKHIAPAGKLVVVHNGMRDIPPELRANPGLASVRICSVARFEAPKDHATLLRALARLRSLRWQLDLVGDGPLLPAMRRLASELGIDERVRFLGYLPDPAPVLAEAQLFALSSRSEAFPRSILEAMRSGLPVVASNVGGVREAVEENRTGVLVPPSSEVALGEAIRGLVDNAAQRELLGTAARLSFNSRFRLERMLEETAAVYANVLCSTTE